MSTHISNVRPDPDKVLVDIADYVLNYPISSSEAYNTARLCLMDTLGCGLEALSYPACTKLLGPIVPGTVVPNGAKVPGTQFQLDPIQAAFNSSSCIIIIQIMGIGGCGRVNFFLRSIFHHIQEIRIQVRFSLEIKNKIEQVFRKFINGLTEKIFLQHACWSCKCS